MKFTKLALAAICLFTTAVLAQVPDPAPAQSKPVALVGGTAHLGNGEVIESAVITFDNGKITAVADMSSIRVNRGTHDIIDTTGKHVYPGFILAASSVGLSEVSSVRATVDTSETGRMNPSVRSIIAYNTDSEMIPTLTFNGLLMAEVMPGGGVISGQSSVVQLDAWNWEDAAVKSDIGVHVQWPRQKVRRFDFATFTRSWQDNKDYDKQLGELEKMLSDARAYKDVKGAPANLKLDAMTGLFDGSKILFVHTSSGPDITSSVLFAKELGVQKIVIVGGEDALSVAPFLVKHKVSVILGGVHRLPGTAEDDIDEPYKLPGLLHEAGVDFCITYPSLMNARNLPFLAGTAAAHGMDKEQALAAITGNVARILGVSDQTGTLENGKDATLFISSGDALDMRTNNVEAAFIMGRNIHLGGMQQRLFERYKKKYGQ